MLRRNSIGCRSYRVEYVITLSCGYSSRGLIRGWIHNHDGSAGNRSSTCVGHVSEYRSNVRLGMGQHRHDRSRQSQAAKRKCSTHPRPPAVQLQISRCQNVITFTVNQCERMSPNCRSTVLVVNFCFEATDRCARHNAVQTGFCAEASVRVRGPLSFCFSLRMLAVWLHWNLPKDA